MDWGTLITCFILLKNILFGSKICIDANNYCTIKNLDGVNNINVFKLVCLQPAAK